MRNKKIPVYVITFFLMYIFFTFVHEISHVITAFMFGNPILEVIFENRVAVKFDILNENAILWMAISGSVGTIIVCIPFLILAVKKRNLMLTYICPMFILKEFIYWTIGSFYNIGDPYNLFWSLENQFNTPVNTFNSYLFFLINTIIMFGLFLVFVYRVWVLKYRLKDMNYIGVDENEK